MRRAGAFVLALFAAACGVASAPGPGMPGGYDAAKADAMLPCTLLTDAEVADVADAPLREVMAKDRVLGPQTTCSWLVGSQARPGLVQITVAHGDVGVSSKELYDLRCGAGTPDGCTMASGLVVRRAGDLTIEASVQSSDGSVDAARSEALVKLVAPRLTALQEPPRS